MKVNMESADGWDGCIQAGTDLSGLGGRGNLTFLLQEDTGGLEDLSFGRYGAGYHLTKQRGPFQSGFRGGGDFFDLLGQFGEE